MPELNFTRFCLFLKYLINLILPKVGKWCLKLRFFSWSTLCETDWLGNVHVKPYFNTQSPPPCSDGPGIDPPGRPVMHLVMYGIFIKNHEFLLPFVVWHSWKIIRNEKKNTTIIYLGSEVNIYQILPFWSPIFLLVQIQLVRLLVE